MIGASAGGLKAVQKIVSQLPPDFPAALLVVIHLHPGSPSLLREILTRDGGLPAVELRDSAPIEPSRIYVAAPDRHLVVERNQVHLSSGPKEQHRRPCINVTLRTAAMAYGDRVVGVILTGQMDDGTAGLWEIKRRNGIAVVQNPEEVLFPSMPLNALREIEVDYTANLEDIAPLLCRLASGEGEQQRTKVETPAMEMRLTGHAGHDRRSTG